MFQQLAASVIAPFLKLGLKAMSKRRLPKISGEVTLFGLKDTVKVARDTYGVPHIIATNSHDLFFTQGYIHAQDRLWQMEMNRRVAKGTLSEVVGPDTLETDRMARTLGFSRLAKNDKENLSEEALEIIEAYVKGINAFINQLDVKYPLEFKLVGFRPENWTVEDCLIFSRLMIWKLSLGWFSEVVRSGVIEAVGEDHAAELEIHYNKDLPFTLPDGIDFNIISEGGLKKAKGPYLKQNSGSNAWVISAEKSATGYPILANDMHLELAIPNIWYYMHLKSDGFNVAGVSSPGAPLIWVGHNEDIAWGATLTYIDCQDLYLEQFDSEDATKYKFGSEWKEATIHREIIQIKNELPHQEKVIVTHHGPIISEFLSSKHQAIALQSTTFQPSKSIDAIIGFNKASDWNEFVDAVKLMSTPSLNLMYADKENIGYIVTGNVPVRAKGDGRTIVPGYTGEYEWTGWVPFKSMPHAFNPKEGYIANCNNKIVDDNFKHYLGTSWMNGYRLARVKEFLDSKEKVSIEDCKALQLDFYNPPHKQFLSHFEGIEIDDPENPELGKALKFMLEFSGELTADSINGALYVVTKYMVINQVLKMHLGTELSQQFSGTGWHPIFLPTHEFYGNDTTVILRLLDDPESWWIKQVGGKEKLLITGFKRAYEWLSNHFGKSPSKWQWGRVHSITFKHPLGEANLALAKVYNRGPYPIGGDPDTPWQMSFLPEAPFEPGVFGPGSRQIIDLGDVTQSIACMPAGQSGQLASKHYDDLIELWRLGKYFPMNWTRGQIELNSEAELELNPM